MLAKKTKKLAAETKINTISSNAEESYDDDEVEYQSFDKGFRRL
jgi:hypothetical protein